MSTNTLAAPTETDITAMTFEQLTAALKAIPAQRQHAIAAADVDALLNFKARERAIREQMSRIKITNLKAEVAKCEAARQEALATRKAVLAESAAGITQAQADMAKFTAALEDARKRHISAINAQGYAEHNVENAQARLNEARARQTAAMTELAEI